MGFWEGERCEYCDGPIAEKKVDVVKKVNKKYALIKNVPAGVCKECGTRYYSANILKTIETSIKRQKAEKEIPMAVYSLGAKTK